MSYKCPVCKDEGTQKVSIAYESGISVVESTTVGLAASIGSGPTMLGVAKTRGTSQTVAAMRLSPPEKISYRKLFYAYVFPSSVTDFMKRLVPGLPKPSVVRLYRDLRAAQTFNNHEYPKLIEEWHNQFICLRCGSRFMPD